MMVWKMISFSRGVFSGSMLIFRGVAMKSCFMTSSISQAGALPARKAPLEEASPKSEAEEIAEEIFGPKMRMGTK